VRQLSECNQDAEISVVIGKVPLSVPVEGISIRENAEGQEVVALMVAHDTFLEILDYGIELIEENNE
jgi:hypothetical protein